LVRPAGFEPAAYGFEVRRSIQLSYGRMIYQMTEDRIQMPEDKMRNLNSLLRWKISTNL
jgi:hypothetical protein